MITDSRPIRRAAATLTAVAAAVAAPLLPTTTAASAEEPTPTPQEGGAQPVVTDDSGVEIDIDGIADSYEPGDTLSAQIVDYTLGDSEQIRWATSHPDSEDRFWYLAHDTSSLEMTIDASHDGNKVWVEIHDTAENEIVAQSGTSELHVTSLAARPTLAWTTGPDVYVGADAVATIGNIDGLREGDTLRGAFRRERDWIPFLAPTVEGSTLSAGLPLAISGQVHVQVVRDGLVIAQSDAYPIAAKSREVLIEGAQDIYRAGQTLSVRGTVHPMAENLSYEWRFRDGAGDSTTEEAIPDEDGVFTFERALTLDDDGGDLRLRARYQSTQGTWTAGSATIDLHVSDADPGEQLVGLDSLAGHYHQGSPISLHMRADPAPADADTTTWEWRWPDGSWATMPGADGQSHELTAEQALDGVQVRATLTIAGTGESFTTEPATIHVDDHGAPPYQQVTVDGLADHYSPGDTVELTASVEPSSVLDRWEWHVQRVGEDTPEPVEGENAATLSLAATEDLDGATVFARLTFPDGTAYVESEPATITVQDDGQDPEPAELSQRVVATLPEDEGALVASVDPQDNVVTMSDFELGTAGDRWESAGQLRPVTVTDTSATAPGWVVSGQVSDFTTNDEQTLAGKHLGWNPVVAQQPDGGNVAPGDAVASALDAGDGLSVSNPLAVANAGNGTGTSQLGADLHIQAPTTLTPGTYQATITFTAI